MSNSIKLLLNKIRYYLLQTFLRKFFFGLKSIFFKLEEYKSILSEKPEQLNNKKSKKIWIFDYTSFFHTPSKAFHGMMLFAKTLSSIGHNVKFIKCNGSPNACNIGFQTLSPNSNMPCKSCIKNRDNLIGDKFSLKFENLSEFESNESLKFFDYKSGLQNIFASSNPTGKKVDIIKKRMEDGANIWFQNLNDIYKKEGNPDILYLFNGKTYPENIISLWAEENNVKIRYFESGVFENSLFFSDNFAASTIFNFDKNEKNDLSKINDLLNSKINSKQDPFNMVSWGSKDVFQNNLYAKRFSIFLNLPYDTSQIDADIVFDDIYSWIDELLIQITKFPEYLFLFNIHPAIYDPKRPSREGLKRYIKKRIKSIKNCYLRDPKFSVSTYQILLNSDGVLTYNSTVGLEARLLKIPVLEAAETHYFRNHVIDPPKNYQDWLSKFNKLINGVLEPMKVEDYNNLSNYYYQLLYKNTFNYSNMKNLNELNNLFYNEIKKIELNH